MIDIHSHLIYLVDDGSGSIEESMTVLKNMNESGITDIILTPHYIKNAKYSSNVKNNTIKLKELKEELKKENININLYLGNEVFVDDGIKELLLKKEISLLNNSKYLLLELPRFDKIINIESLFYNLRSNGIVPIIAHPERYSYFNNNYDLVQKYRDMGVLYQGNLFSLTLKHGRIAKKLLTRMLKDGYIDIIATDTHHYFLCDEYNKAVKKLGKIVSNKEDLLQNNPLKVLNNETIIIKDLYVKN